MQGSNKSITLPFLVEQCCLTVIIFYPSHWLLSSLIKLLLDLPPPPILFHGPSLTRTLEENVYKIALSLAQRYSIPLWEVYMTHLEFLFSDSG